MNETIRIPPIFAAMTDFGAFIKQKRLERGWSQTELGRRAGNIKQPSVAAIESGDTQKSRYLPDLARALGVELPETPQVIRPSLPLYPEKANARETPTAMIEQAARLLAPLLKSPVSVEAMAWKIQRLIEQENKE